MMTAPSSSPRTIEDYSRRLKDISKDLSRGAVPPSFTEEFLRNSREKAALLKTDDDLLKRIAQVGKEMRSNADRYRAVSPQQIGLKRRGDSAEGIIEIAVMADLYHPALRMSPFVVSVRGRGIMPGELYLVQDFGIIKELCEVNPDANSWRDVDLRLGLRFESAETYMTEKGYERGNENLDALMGRDEDLHHWQEHYLKRWVWQILRGDYERTFALDSTRKLVCHDLDCKNIKGREEILHGALEGIGPFSRLHKPWVELQKPEYTIQLD